MSELEKLARKGRTQARRAPRRAANPPPGPRNEELKRARVAIGLAQPWGVWGGVLGLPILMMVVGFVGHVIAELPGDPGLTALSLGVLAVVLNFALVQPLLIRRERRWMQNLPYRFDVDRYLLQLGKARHCTLIRVMLHFKAPIPSGARSLLRDAARGVSADAHAEFDENGALIISTEKSTYSTRYKETVRHRNDGVHEFVRTVLRKAVAPIHASHGVEQVTVDLSEKR